MVKIVVRTDSEPLFVFENPLQQILIFHLSGCNCKTNSRHVIYGRMDFNTVGLAVAAGEMKYEDLLEWILENK